MTNLYVEDGVIRCSKSGADEEYVFQSLEAFQENSYIVLSNNGKQKVRIHYSSLQIGGVNYGTAALTTDAIAALLATLVSSGGGGGGGGGDASASNQSTQITAANLTNTKLDEIKVKQDTQITTLGTLNTKTPALGQAAMSASQPVVIASDQSNLAVIPLMASGGNVSAQTNATGTNWTAYGSQVCRQCTLSNQTGTTIEVRQGGSGVGLQIPTGAFYTFFGITNTNQLEVRRVDTSNTQVTVTARWEA